MDDLDRNDMSYWFPPLEASGLQVPRTILLDAGRDLGGLLDGDEDAVPALMSLADRVREAGQGLGWPVFLRTGHGSGKHQWADTCLVAAPEDVQGHITALVEWSHLVDFMGLPTRTWAVREFLRLRHYFTAFNGMPVAREFRLFVRDGRVECLHPYWPADAIWGASARESAWRPQLDAISLLDHGEGVMLGQRVEGALASRPSALSAGYWSLDLAQLAGGDPSAPAAGGGWESWVATDMAEGERSFHWADCVHEPAQQRQERETVVASEVGAGALVPIGPATTEQGVASDIATRLSEFGYHDVSAEEVIRQLSMDPDRRAPLGHFAARLALDYRPDEDRG